MIQEKIDAVPIRRRMTPVTTPVLTSIEPHVGPGDFLVDENGDDEPVDDGQHGRLGGRRDPAEDPSENNHRHTEGDNGLFEGPSDPAPEKGWRSPGSRPISG